MTKTTRRNVVSARLSALDVRPAVRNETPERRDSGSDLHSLECEPASYSYYGQVNLVLERIRDENTFEAQLIRSILGHNLPRR